jgi:hypothetical protein
MKVIAGRWNGREEQVRRQNEEESEEWLCHKGEMRWYKKNAQR